MTHSLDDAVSRLRARKTAGEIALLKKAAEISARGHTEAMKAAAPGCGENEIQALLEGGFRRFGGDGRDTAASSAPDPMPRSFIT